MKPIRLQFFIILCFFSLSSLGFGSVLKPFETDYCTNFPEGTKQEPERWKDCCLYHDLYFWAGGTKQERKKADSDLRDCIHKTGAHRIAQLVYLGVRAGYYSPIKYAQKKWSNGWDYQNSYRALTPQDIIEIEKELNSGHEYIKDKQAFINSLKDRKN